MRYIVGYADFSSVCGDDGFAQGKSQSEASPAVSNRRRTGVKRVKDMRFIFVGDSWSVIGNDYFNKIILLICTDFNMRILWGIFNGIVYYINNDLHNQLGVDLCKKQFVRVLKGDMMLAAVTVDMMQRFRNDFIDQLRLSAKIHLPIFDACDCKEIFNKVDQPHGIIIDIRV